MHACQAPTPDCRKPKLTHYPASISCTHYANTTHRLDYGAHIRFALHNYRLPALHFSRLCIIPRQAFLATSFTLLSRSTAARCSSLQHPALHLTTDAISCSTKSTFPPALAFGLPKKKNGGGDTWGSWIEQRHRQSNLHPRDTTFFSSSPVQLLLGILPQLGVLATDGLTWQGWVIRTIIPSVGHRNCGIYHGHCRLLLAHWSAGRSTELNGRGGRHLDYCAVLRVSLSGGFLLSLVIITDTQSCNFLRVLENKNAGRISPHHSISTRIPAHTGCTTQTVTRSWIED
jgi:hypothetical protein